VELVKNNDRDIKIIEYDDTFKANEEEPEKKEKIKKSKDEIIDDKASLDGGKYSGEPDRRMDYFDFELEIGSGIGREYPVSIIRSPAGEVHETVRFPFDELELENALKDIQISLLRSGGKNRQILSPEEEKVKDFGKKLFDTLLGSKLRGYYDVSLREAAQQGKGLRLKLRIEPPELAALPWEFLYDSHQADYVSLSSNIPVIRYLELPQSIQALSVDPPLQILGMTASPHDLPPLDVEREKQRVEEAIKNLREQGLVDITWLPGQTWEDLQQAMRTGNWHIFHFIGHGGFDRNTDEGLIALSDEDGQAFHLSATQLGRFLAGHGYLRLVILNSCSGAQGSKRDIFSSTAAILVRKGIPAVLAMQYEISDKAAIAFARAFYLALADGLPVDAAVGEARIAVSVALTNTIEWGTPVLYMRSPDGILFKIHKTPAQPPDIIKKLIFAAKQLYDTGKYAEAIDAWNKILNLVPENEIAIKGKKEADDNIKKYCPNCGTQNVRRKEFCRKCGIRLYRTSK
jgi:predicted RNA-binding Zn-ribbon protein involved in translation (DUF1610 family)